MALKDYQPGSRLRLLHTCPEHEPKQSNADPIIGEEGEEVWEVTDIAGYREVDGKLQYRVKWKGNHCQT